MSQHVIGESYVLHIDPWRTPVFRARSDQKSESGLSVHPVVFQNVPGDQYPLCDLEFQQVLDRPMIPRITGTSYHPTHRLEKVIPTNFDIRGDVTNQRRSSPPKLTPFSRRFQIVVG